MGDMEEIILPFNLSLKIPCPVPKKQDHIRKKKN
jgi:hypothetical protein